MTAARAALAGRERGWALVLAALALLAYGAAVAGDYVFDDVHSVFANEALRDLGELPRLLTDPSAFSGTGQRMYRPVLLVSFALNMAVSAEPWAHKLGNVLLHAAIVVLAFGWLRRLSVPAAARGVALALFAVHPLAAEAINLVSARSELLLVLGLVIGLRCHLAWLRGRRPALSMVGMLLGGAIACGSKETGVVLPLLMFGQAWCTRRAAWTRSDLWRTARAVLPVLALVLGYLVLRKLLLGQATVELLGRTGSDPTAGYGRTLLTQLATMGTLLPRGLLQMFAPIGLSFDPPVVYRHSFADPFVLAGWAGMAGITFAAVRPGPRAGVRRLGALFAWLVAGPWIVVPLNMPFAEHRLYGPLLGVFLALAAPIANGARWRGWRGFEPRWLPLAAALLLGIGLSATRSSDYRDERLLWRAELAHRPLAWRAWWGLGMAEIRYENAMGAVEPLANAHALLPTHYDILRHYTEALLRLPPAVQQPFRAVAVAGMLRQRGPRDPWVHALSAEACLQAGRASGDKTWFEQAERLALACLELGPPKALVYRLAATARRELGDFEGALTHLDASIARGLDFVPVRLERAGLLGKLGRQAEARAELRKLQAEAPFDPAVQAAARVLAAPGR